MRPTHAEELDKWLDENPEAGKAIARKALHTIWLDHHLEGDGLYAHSESELDSATDVVMELNVVARDFGLMPLLDRLTAHTEFLTENEDLDPRDYYLDGMECDFHNGNYGGDPEIYRHTYRVYDNIRNGNLTDARELYRTMGLTLADVLEDDNVDISAEELARALQL